LHRVGKCVSLGDLPEGKWRALTNAERDAMVRAAR
jgi:16S rRNA U516 pseudouridylate synthase RsuA-like enzyme